MIMDGFNVYGTERGGGRKGYACVPHNYPNLLMPYVGVMLSFLRDAHIPHKSKGNCYWMEFPTWRALAKRWGYDRHWLRKAVGELYFIGIRCKSGVTSRWRLEIQPQYWIGGTNGVSITK